MLKQVQFAGYASVFTWLTFGMLSIAAMVYAIKFGSSIPFGDDWAVVPKIAATVPTDIGWYFESHNAHRYPVGRLAMAISWNLGHDVRWGLALNVGVYIFFIATTTYLVIGLSRRAKYTDAIVPLVMLNLAHGTNMIWWIQSFFLWAGSMSSVLVASFFCASAYDTKLKRSFFALVLIGLSWQGAMGAIMTPVLAIGYLYCTWQALNSGWRMLWSAAGAGLSLVSPTLLFIEVVLGKSSSTTADHSLTEVIQATLQFLSSSTGPLGMRLPMITGSLILMLIVLTLVRNRDRSARLAIVVGSMAVLAVAVCISISRPGGLEGRYTVLACPILIVVYCGLKLTPESGAVEFLRISMFALCASPVCYNASYALEEGKQRIRMQTEFLTAIEKQVPLTAVAGVYGQYWSWNAQSLETGLRSLREAGIFPYQRLLEMPPSISQPLVVPAEAKMSEIVLSMPGRSNRVLGIELEYTLHNGSGLSILRLSWDRGASYSPYERISTRESFVKPHTGSPRKQNMLWIDDYPTDLRITAGPGESITLHSAIVLVVPDRSDKEESR